MRIGIYDPYLNDFGGGEKYMMTIAQCLSEDNDVVVFWDKEEDLKSVALRFSLDISKIMIKENIFSSQYAFSKRFLESLKYDVIIVLSDGSIPFIFCKRLLVHFQQPFPEIKMSLRKSLKKMLVSSFFCNSYFTKSFIDKEFKIKSEVIYPPIELKIDSTRKENIILHVGRFRAVNLEMKDYKKQEVMIDIFKKMIDKGLKNWKFVLAVGLQEKDKEKFERLRKNSKGYPIEFMINPTIEDLKKQYAKSKIYWHASGFGEDLDKNPQLAEHFGISTVEAMRGGSVPVVINAGGQKEIVENGKNGFLWNTSEELMEKTEMLVHDTKLLEKLSKDAIEKSKIYDYRTFCKKIKNLIYR